MGQTPVLSSWGRREENKMEYVRGSDIFAPDEEGFRRRVIDEGQGPVRSYGYSNPPNTDSVEHCHADSTELFLVVDGEGSLVVEGVEVPMSRSDVLIVEPGEFHFVRSGSTPFHLFCVVTPNLDDAKFR
jgi:mannose-6-phosphate isomerase-like protein (cupin superfamily)